MRAVKRTILLCWIMLIVCFIIKLFGGNWFEIICDNEHFISVCKYIDTHWIVSYFIGFLLYVSSTFFVMLATCRIYKPSKKQTILILLVLTAVWFSQFISLFIKMLVEILMFLLLPFFVKSVEVGFKNWKSTIKNTWQLGIIGCALTYAFQIISLITRNVGIDFVDNSFLITYILMIDYYIMIAIYYLYIKLRLKKEIEKNG